MQTTVPIMYGKCHSGVTYATEPRDNIETSSANAVSEIKTVFFTPEGIYRQMTISEYIRSNRIPLSQTVCPISNTLVRVSFIKVSLKDDKNFAENQTSCDYIERICFNVGREVYVYDYGGIYGDSKFSKPIDKRVYKGTFPTCHDFNAETATTDSSSLLVGFTAGQVQLFDPYQKDGQSKLYNEDRSIDKSPVTHLRWVPGQTSLFIVAHASGNLYVYNEEYVWMPNAPVYQPVKHGDGFFVSSCKSKTPRNPVLRWSITGAESGVSSAINQFEFSPGVTIAGEKKLERAKYLATVGQDGFLRVFDYAAMELVGFMRSYFGGLLCLAWSPDARLIATGGEDDMLTIYSMVESRVLCRGQGHKSWVSQVAFDHVASICSTSVPTAFSAPSIASNATTSLSPLSTFATIQKIADEHNDSLNNFQGNHAKHTLLNGKNAFSNKNAKILPEQSDSKCGIYRNGTNAKQLVSADFYNENNLHDNHVTRTPVTFINGSTENFLPAASTPTRLENTMMMLPTVPSTSAALSPAHTTATASIHATTALTRSCYRIGSVGYDTQLCLWDLSEDVICSCDTNEDVLAQNGASSSTITTAVGGCSSGPGSSNSIANSQQPHSSSQNRTLISIGMSKALDKGEFPSVSQSKTQSPTDSTDINSTVSQSTGRGEAAKSKLRKLHKRGLSFGSRLNDRWLRGNSASATTNGFPIASLTSGATAAGATLRRNNNATINGDENSACTGHGTASSMSIIFGTAQCPRMDDVPVIEPLVCKKIAHEHLTVLQFRDDCIVTACQEGIVLTWERPGKTQSISPAHSNTNGRSKTRYYSTSSANAAADFDGMFI